ncbi:hydantoinase/oxoprolinase family protein [Microbacterium sp. cf332]|uniref:hydantoinase/oxoprolinase family protein n=1 Tax=Microbacterium sp. cf332 TaxID=1761804 RepID=UPI00088B43A6|nr:hydantoinase/oxoprolinase family protein [Microbacterium sp. cf332]SDQ94699.1 N-methylhydantoinase A [Microbacterium sp. cf332]
MKRIGIDAGGTFTDAVLWDDERGIISATKVSSRGDDPAGAVVAAARRVVELAPGIDHDDVEELVHGTTIGTNLALERNGSRIAMLATEGFRDVLEIARLTRPASALYDLLDPGPRPLVARRDRFEIPGRIDGDGSVVRELDDEAVRAAARTIRARGITSVAVAFLYAHVDARHERRAAEILRDEVPELSVSLSSDVLPQVREFERTATTVLNAYLKPVCAPYLESLTARIAEWNPDVRTWIMQSNGGVTSPANAAQTPVNLLLSGPSGGVVAGRLVSRQTGIADTITVDMGGTSFDVCLIADAQVPLTTSSRAMDLPVQVPTVDIETIGTGGGSIAHVDAGGQFLVGPQSAGARPGPAAYGRGGTEPTVTDANVVLGILEDGVRLGDDVVVDRASALAACTRLGERLGLDPIATALGIRRISNAAMAGAVRAASVGRGHDPRSFALTAFGGAGPMHAADIALELSIPTVIVPPSAGVLSAVGLVVSDVVHNHAASFMARMDTSIEPSLTASLTALADQATAHLDAEGVDAADQTILYGLDLHYAGQNTSITVTVDRVDVPGWTVRAIEGFHRLHEQLNGFRVDGENVDVAVARVTGVGAVTGGGESEPAPAEEREAIPSGERVLHLSSTERSVVPLFHRDDLLPGHFFHGAAVVVSDNTTVVVPPASRTTVDAHGNLLLHLKGRA